MRAESVDAYLAQGFAQLEKTGGQHLELDLGGAKYIEPAALQMLIAAIMQMRRKETGLTLRIPREQKQRDFWRAWGFPTALNLAMGTTEFKRIVAPADLRYFSEKQRYYLPVQLPAHPGFPGEAVRSTNFYGFHTEKLESLQQSMRPAYVEKDNWNVAHIRSVLNGKLGSKSSYFSSRIVFEAMLNALTHPGAGVVQTASLDDKPGKTFTTHFWDDGLSMGETLRTAIDKGTASQSKIDDDFDRKYLVVFSRDDRPDEKACEIVRGSEVALSPGLDPHRALFATLLPGVTSDPCGENHSVPEETTQADVRYGRRGMGLYVLVNAVVEVLDGSVAFRTGRYFMYVRKPKPKEIATHGEAHLHVRIKERPSVLPDFLGNLVTVRLQVPEAR